MAGRDDRWNVATTQPAGADRMEAPHCGCGYYRARSNISESVGNCSGNRIGSRLRQPKEDRIEFLTSLWNPIANIAGAAFTVVAMHTWGRFRTRVLSLRWTSQTQTFALSGATEQLGTVESQIASRAGNQSSAQNRSFMAGLEGQMLDDSSFWTPQRRELLAWLNDRAPSFSPGYMAALRLLHTSFPARVHLICHLIRDFYRYLPAALGVKGAARPAEVFPPMVKQLAKAWGDSPAEQSGSPAAPGTDVVVSPEVYKQLTRIINRSGELGRQLSVGEQLAVALFRSTERRDDEFMHPWVIDSFDREFKFFVSRAHLAQSLDKIPTDDGLIEHFQAFERSFHSLVGSYFTGKDELDDILRDTNATTD